ncbi:alanyl-tRNA editing protein [Lacrimispora sp.]|uniref:alanyl-tRNA editing protein n=1 Tax=Lacrimispora sp. TaxID=2719234 RepID=UPI0028B1ABDC|nr:alanyl-tRNA editing protein [Lacrimispora sp.]
MEKLYYEKPYVTNFEAEVIDCRQGKNGQYEVLLNRTAFYPEGGGQPADTGRLGEAKVLDVQERAEGIVHIVDMQLLPESKLIGIVDWDRRFFLMQNHSGEHILSGIVHKHYGYDNVGFHMGKDEITVDFNGVLTWDQAEAIEEEVNDLIWKNVPIIECYPSKEELSSMDYRSKKELSGQVRIIEIPNGDVCACCGTHVMTTGEIGMVKVTGLMNYKGGVRMSMLCGKLALLDYRKKMKSVSSISALLSAKPDGILDAVDKLKEEGLKKDGLIGRLFKVLLDKKVLEYPISDQPLVVFEDGLSPVQLRQLCTMLYEGQKGNVVLVCSGADHMYQYAVGSSLMDMRSLSKSMNEKLDGRGGGNSLMAQGTFRADAKEIEEIFVNEMKGEQHGVK